MAKGKKGRTGIVSSLRLFGLWPIALAQSLWPCTLPVPHGREGGENANANEGMGRGMGMGNGLLSSFGAWPGPKRPVKVIGKVSEIGAGQ